MIAQTPPMGWNSWDCYGAAVDEPTVRQNAAYMAEHLKEFGWEYVVVDIQWYQPTATSHAYEPARAPYRGQTQRRSGGCHTQLPRRAALPADSAAGTLPSPSLPGGRCSGSCGSCLRPVRRASPLYRRKARYRSGLRFPRGHSQLPSNRQSYQHRRQNHAAIVHKRS